MRLIISVFFLLVIKPSGFSQHEADDLLFTIGRSSDENIIYYAVNLDENGNLIQENPIQIYWIKHSEYEQTEPLTLLQKKMAYGLKFLKTDTIPIEFQFVSYKKKSLFLDKNPDEFYRVFTFAAENGKMVQLNHIFIQIDGGSFLFPTIGYVALNVSNPHCNTEFAEIIIPE
jgi:hypothetical protein